MLPQLLLAVEPSAARLTSSTPPAGVGVDVLEVVGGKRERRSGDQLIVRVERDDVDHARRPCRETRAASRRPGIGEIASGVSPSAAPLLSTSL